MGFRKTFLKLQKYVMVLLIVSFVSGMILGITLVTNPSMGSRKMFGLFNSKQSKDQIARLKHLQNHRNRHETQRGGGLSKTRNYIIHSNHSALIPSYVPIRVPPIQKAVDVQDDDDARAARGEYVEPNYKIHAFYYAWYGAPPVDKDWLHWNHAYIPHWDKVEAGRWPQGRHQPPADIGSNFYPQLGPYSSRDPRVLESHMKQLRTAGIGTIALSWYPPFMADDNGTYHPDTVTLVMDAAAKLKIKVCFHVEPYKDRDAASLRGHLARLLRDHGNHPAFYRVQHRGRRYLVPQSDWASLLTARGELTVRGTALDAVFLGLVVEQRHSVELRDAGFDGFYTYFASDGFSFGSSLRHWPGLARFAHKHRLLFSPSVGPGYVDVRVRPWNGRNTKEREQGGYYEQGLRAALATNSAFVSITSFNEWHEGTQIEAAVPRSAPGYTYQDYSPQRPDYYLSLTRSWARKLRKAE